MIVSLENKDDPEYCTNYNSNLTLLEFLDMIINTPDKVYSYFENQPKDWCSEKDAYWIDYYPSDNKLIMCLNLFDDYYQIDDDIQIRSWPLDQLEKYRDEILKTESEFKSIHDQYLNRSFLNFQVPFSVYGFMDVDARDEREARELAYDILCDKNKEYYYVDVNIRDPEIKPENVKE